MSKYRNRIPAGRVSVRLAELFQECTEINQFEIIEPSIQSDCVHILLSVKPCHSPAGIMRFMKGGSSRVISDEFPGLREFLWGESFWADGYFVFTHSVVFKTVIINYIKNQDKYY